MNTPRQQNDEGWAESEQLQDECKAPKLAADILAGTIFKNIKMPPPEEMERRKKEHDAFQERLRQAKVESIREFWDAPKRQVLCKPNHSGAWGSALSGLKMKLGTGMLVGLCSERGTGKTQIAVELMKAVTEKLEHALYTSATGFFTRVKSGYGGREGGESEEVVMRDFRKKSLVVIDEIGKRSESSWENNLLFELINNRYGDMTDTILIDNRKKEDFIQTIGPSLASRMMETGGIIECNWESFRK